MDIKGSVAVITGGASGLGEACVRNFIGKGGKVSILDFARERGQAVASELGEAALFCMTDITKEEDVQAAIDKTVETFGAIHVAVNCAGVGIPAKVLGKEGPMSMNHFNKVVQINLMGTINIIRLAAEKMLKNQGNDDGEKGVVINTASVAAFDGQIGQAAYSASKAGVVGMTLPIAREFAEYGIRVMTIAPGIFSTPMLRGLPENVQEALAKMVPFPKRLGEPSEFAGLVQHIVENPMLNGEVIRLDGSLRMAAK
ncbi:MAG: 3-hydroxyacyl-CoA dehydrogenase [Pseudomonadota bacterium]|nr:3-hydroxyacyl-CoA dehydrogenase [Desulfobacterales bacterium]MBL7171561.1 3-hydroxyacyl-CoA dehydrogenase [Desulfobacteraceae bacterium]MBU0735429.1 3-hydroxyacyl-CoA dehydrogenase [Pseudomonadota bacterium]MBU0989432.1 3-hydroxyacyl-CoA dehydrogenase [Pseudomonadota bacterium]